MPDLSTDPKKTPPAGPPSSLDDLDNQAQDSLDKAASSVTAEPPKPEEVKLPEASLDTKPPKEPSPVKPPSFPPMQGAEPPTTEEAKPEKEKKAEEFEERLGALGVKTPPPGKAKKGRIIMAVIALLFVLASVPAAVFLVQQRQELRKAAEECGGVCAPLGNEDCIDGFIWKCEAKDQWRWCKTNETCGGAATPTPGGGGGGETSTCPSGDQGQPGESCNNLNKCDIAGGCNPACCAVDADCPNNQECTVPNGYCRKGKSCKAKETQQYQGCVNNQCVWTIEPGLPTCSQHADCQPGNTPTPGGETTNCGNITGVSNQSTCCCFCANDTGVAATGCCVGLPSSACDGWASENPGQVGMAYCAPSGTDAGGEVIYHAACRAIGDSPHNAEFCVPQFGETCTTEISGNCTSCDNGVRCIPSITPTPTPGGGNTPTPTTPTNTPIPGIPACSGIQVANNAWTAILNSTDLAALQPGDDVNLVVLGAASGPGINYTEARFRVNGGAWQTSTAQVGTRMTGALDPNAFFWPYTIPGGTTTFAIDAEVYSPSCSCWK